ncbi:hypothetical protein FIA58_012865 [Flavobacterium jejuense]|uniref:Haem-binding uptake Tiki superfamily ChaN domain-containing protein n=1 Tax=Flavobacterium jejuense TaxID=1544455 RepID=A0ABX0ISN1_9FLAO|nr:hypothetical protein [Flavobacterium jejuense]NHN26571.1 hypothetical protein [Flavobacterium jejuense]
MKIIYILCFLSLSNVLIAQVAKEKYQFSKDINAAIEKDTLAWKYQLGAVEYATSGYYREALTTWDKNGGGFKKLSAKDSLYFKNFKPKSAKEYIIERSKAEQIIIINEAHHNARHRVFTTSLLRGLYENGYRFLGLEALSDTLINDRKFPTIKSGYYVKEPQMANLIRVALEMGFTLFEYEATDGKNGKEREIEQAENIKKIIDENPNSKFLIHCGYDHVIEGTPKIKRWEKAMAGRLKKITNRNPFTIDQVTYSEKSDLKFTNPIIELVNKATSVVLIDEKGSLFNGLADNDKVDCQIIHPITKYISYRPNWLLLDKERKKYTIPKSKINQYPALVLAFKYNEYEHQGIPVDVVEILNKEEIPKLMLPAGKYQILIKNKMYEIVSIYTLTIK